MEEQVKDLIKYMKTKQKNWTYIFYIREKSKRINKRIYDLENDIKKRPFYSKHMEPRLENTTS